MSEADRMEKASIYVTDEVYDARFTRAEPLYQRQRVDHGFRYSGINRRASFANVDEALAEVRRQFNGS